VSIGFLEDGVQSVIGIRARCGAFFEHDRLESPAEGVADRVA
jgi:hypothetical protein